MGEVIALAIGGLLASGGLILAFAALCACIRSSQISRMEEREVTWRMTSNCE